MNYRFVTIAMFLLLVKVNPCWAQWTCGASGSGSGSGGGVYTATLNIGQPIYMGTYRGPLGNFSGTFNQNVPVGTYSVVLTPTNTIPTPYNTTMIYRDPNTGQRWRYINQQGGCEILSESFNNWAGTCASGTCR